MFLHAFPVSKLEALRLRHPAGDVADTRRQGPCWVSHFKLRIITPFDMDRLAWAPYWSHVLGDQVGMVRMCRSSRFYISGQSLLSIAN